MALFHIGAGRRTVLATGTAILLLASAATAIQAQSTTPTATPIARTRPAGQSGADAQARTVTRLLNKELGVAAKAIGIPAKDLKKEIRGTTIAAEAQKHNVATATVAAAVVADVNARIDARVTDGKLTTAQATQLKAAVPARVDAFLQQAHAPRAAKPKKNA